MAGTIFCWAEEILRARAESRVFQRCLGLYHGTAKMVVKNNNYIRYTTYKPPLFKCSVIVEVNSLRYITNCTKTIILLPRKTSG